MTTPGVLGNCVFCDLPVHYETPSPGGGQTDLEGLYDPRIHPPRGGPWRGFTLLDDGGVEECFGAGAQREAAVAVGQVAHHVLPGGPIG